MLIDTEKGITLTKPAARGAPRVYHVHRDKASLVTRTSAGSKAPAEAKKSLKTPEEAAREFFKVVKTKLRDGYALLRGREGAPRGAVVFAGFASGGGGGAVLDASPDGRYALTAGHSGAPREVWVETIDLSTGERKTVFEASHPSQIFLHSAHFELDEGRILISVGDDIISAPLGGGKPDVVGTYKNATGQPHPFNPHVLRPQVSADRSRLVLFDERLRVRVVDARRKALLEAPMAHRTTECRAVGLSPSGKRLALFRVSRGIVYNHDDARKDTTCEVDIWDVDQGKMLDTLPVAQQVAQLGFDADDRLLFATLDHNRGPVAHDLKTKKIAFKFEDKNQEDGLDHVNDFASSPDGSLLAVASHTTRLFDARTRAPVELEPFSYRADIVAFARGQLVSFEDGMCVARTTA